MTPLFVADLSRPAGAAVDRHGRGRCIACGCVRPLAALDIVGLGYRCATCTGQAQITQAATGEPDVLANLPAGDRAALHRLGKRGLRSGVWVTIAGVVFFPVALAFHSRLALAPLMAGLIMIAIGRDQIRIGRSTN